MNGRDTAAVLELFGRCFDQPRPEAFWRHLYPDNPLGAGVASLVVDPAGRAVAHLGGLPVRLALDGDRLSAAQQVDLMVDEPHRNRPSGRTSVLDALLRHFDAVSGFEVTFCFPRAEVARLLERLFGYRPVGTLAYHRRRPRRFGGKGGCRLREVARFGSEADALWRRVAPGLGAAVVRDADYLNWRYVGPVRADYRRYLMVDRLSDSPRGWAVLRTDGADWEVIDLLALTPWEPRLIRCLEGLAAAQGARRVTLRTLSESPLSRRLMAQEYRYEWTELTLMVRAYSPHVDASRLSGPWHLLAGDSDRV